MTPEIKRPKVLSQDPIVAAMFEVRFEASTSGVADLLPGFLYPLLGDVYSNVETLPAGEIPKGIRDQMPNSAYEGTRRLVGEGTNLVIAEKAVVVEVTKPYWGWEKFSTLIFRVISAINDTNLVGQCERTSLRYQNLLTTKDDPNDLTGLELEIAFANYEVRDKGIQLRVEVESGGCVSIVQVAGSAQLTRAIDGEQTNLKGLLIDIDTIKYPPLDNFWTDYKKIIEGIHETEKEVFYNLLKDETIESLGPVWE